MPVPGAVRLMFVLRLRHVLLREGHPETADIEARWQSMSGHCAQSLYRLLGETS